MNFIKDVTRVVVVNFAASAAATAGLFAGLIVIGEGAEVISNGSKKLFGKFKNKEEEE